MKFKAYGWTGLYRASDADEKYWTLNINLIPHAEIEICRHDFPPDDSFKVRRNGVNIFIMFAWLVFGFTLDFRFGRDTGAE